MAMFRCGGGTTKPEVIQQKAFITDKYSTDATKTVTIPSGYKNKKALIIVSCTSNGHLLNLYFRHNSDNAVACNKTNIGSGCMVYAGNGVANVTSGDTITITYKTNGTQTFYIEVFVVAV